MKRKGAAGRRFEIGGWDWIAIITLKNITTSLLIRKQHVDNISKWSQDGKQLIVADAHNKKLWKV